MSWFDHLEGIISFLESCFVSPMPCFYFTYVSIQHDNKRAVYWACKWTFMFLQLHLHKILFFRDYSHLLQKRHETCSSEKQELDMKRVILTNWSCG